MSGCILLRMEVEEEGGEVRVARELARRLRNGRHDWQQAPYTVSSSLRSLYRAPFTPPGHTHDPFPHLLGPTSDHLAGATHR
ncbi:hypothetical protein E2C01_014642 [Portunus trituberculatus]|uniref:Uncharacterized protein n=1 Tax=Portunus trituberculatus TaxID=210409 RepID=A0A5B7DJP6_PORTR|nr:hypothetical protein [Portunus trituberculatus]